MSTRCCPVCKPEFGGLLNFSWGRDELSPGGESQRTAPEGPDEMIRTGHKSARRYVSPLAWGAYQ